MFSGQCEQERCTIKLGRREIWSALVYCSNMGVLLPADYLLGSGMIWGGRVPVLQWVGVVLDLQ